MLISARTGRHELLVCLKSRKIDAALQFAETLTVRIRVRLQAYHKCCISIAPSQFAEKRTVRIRVCLQAYRKCCVFSSAFRRRVGASEFFSTLFKRCARANRPRARIPE
jgi:hypothetical protein